MDELVIKYYRCLLRTGFDHAGSLENPEIFLDSVGDKIHICGHGSQNYMHIYIKVVNQKIDDIKYLCTCDPTANVVVEVLCKILKGKSLVEAEKITIESFSSEVGSTGEEFLKKSSGIIELLQRGLQRYHQEKSRP